MEGWAAIRHKRMAELSNLRAGCSLPQREFVRAHLSEKLSGHQRYLMQTERLGHVTFPRTRPEIESGTSRLVAQCLNHRSPPLLTKVRNTRVYLLARQQCKWKPFLCFHGSTLEFHITNSYT